MLSKCANPDCSNSFLYLHDGKLFRIHMDRGAPETGSSSAFEPDTKKPARRVEFFWLCGECSAKMTLNFETGAGVKIVPLDSFHAIAC